MIPLSPDSSPPDLLTFATASDRSGISRTVLYEQAAAGRLDVRKLGRRSYITLSSLDRLIADLPKAPFAAEGAA